MFILLLQNTWFPSGGILHHNTIYITTDNRADIFKSFNKIYKCRDNCHKRISDLNSNDYNHNSVKNPELRGALIKYLMKQDTFIIIDRNRTMIYDPRVDFLDLKALSLKGELSNEEINKAIA